MTTKNILQKLEELERELIQRKVPIIGPEKGSWLLQQVQKEKPKNILELGTARGYSGIILGSEGAHITTIELNPEAVKEAKRNLQTFNIDAECICGNAVEEIKNFPSSSFDLIFIDFYKHGYDKVIDDCINLVKKNGLIIADNLSSPWISKFKEKILTDKRLNTEIIEIKDGMSCSRRVL